MQIAASPNNAQQVLYACMETFEDLKTDSPISHDNLDSAKKVRTEGEQRVGPGLADWRHRGQGAEGDRCSLHGLVWCALLVCDRPRSWPVCPR